MRTTRWLLPALAAGALGFASTVSAAQSGTASSSSGMSSDRNDNTGTGAAASATSTGNKKLSNKLQDGLQQLHAADQGEIQAGQQAQQSATSSDVKAFGQRMVTDHTQNDQKLTSMAQTLGVSLEGKAFQKEQKDAEKTMKKLQGKTGADWDKAYVDQMVKDHEKDAKDVKKLSNEARKDGQSELAAFLDQTEQTIQGHLTAARQLKSAEKMASKRSSSTTTGTGSSTDTSNPNANGTNVNGNGNNPSPSDTSGNKKGY